MKYTEREREILSGWPTVTEQDLERMNDLFPHYLFFQREGDLRGLRAIKLWASCCGHKETRPYLTRTQDEPHWTLLDLAHRDRLTCPWCGREETALDHTSARGRTGLGQYFSAVFTCTEVGAGKGRPDVYEAALSALGTPRENTWVFEDSLFAMRTAKAAGFPVAGVYDAAQDEVQQEVRALADCYIPAFTALRPPV